MFKSSLEFKTSNFNFPSFQGTAFVFGRVCQVKTNRPVIRFEVEMIVRPGPLERKDSKRAERARASASWSASSEPLPGGRRLQEKGRPSSPTSNSTAVLVRRSPLGLGHEEGSSRAKSLRCRSGPSIRTDERCANLTSLDGSGSMS